MPSYYPKNQLVQDRQLKVQRLVIPFTIVGSATPANVTLRNDEPSFMFMQSEGVNQITAALSAGETATYATSPVDANGTANIFLKLGETVAKVQRACVTDREDGVLHPCFLGDTDGLSSLGNIMLTLDANEAFTSGTKLYCLDVEYVVSE